MIDQLFGSKTRVKLLNLFYGNPNRSFYVREITRKIDEQINSVRRELANLLSIGIITSDNSNNRLYYEVNQKYEFFEPLAMVFGGKPSIETKQTNKKTPLVQQQENPELSSLGNIEIALLTGQFTRDDRSGTDMLLVGDINQTRLSKYITDLESKEGKEIRYTTMSTSDFDYRLQVNDRFLSNVIASKKQIIIDKYQKL